MGTQRSIVQTSSSEAHFELSGVARQRPDPSHASVVQVKLSAVQALPEGLFGCMQVPLLQVSLVHWLVSAVQVVPSVLWFVWQVPLASQVSGLSQSEVDE